MSVVFLEALSMETGTWCESISSINSVVGKAREAVGAAIVNTLGETHIQHVS